MTKSMKKKSLICLSILFCIYVVFGGILLGALQKNVSAEEDTLKTEYTLDYDLYIPELTVEGIAATEYSLLYPSGLLKDGRAHILNETGKYIVKYSANIDGSLVTKTETFVVQKSIVTFSSEDSSAYYGVHEYAPNTSGLVVEVANGDWLRFNQIVDVSKMTSSDSLFKFFVTPNEIGQEDVSTIVFRMTDIYDESNYIDVMMKNLSATYGDWADRQTYYVVQAGENDPVAGPGLAGIWGWPTYQSTTGVDPYGQSIGSNRPWSVSLDYKNRDIWCHEYCLYDGTGGSDNWNGIPLADLDNTEYMETPWQGFTTGEVYISFYGISYQAPTMNLLITEVAGIDLTQESFYDTEAPVIKVDFVGNDVVPDGVLNKGYKIFDATAVDSYDGDRKVDVNVYYNYNTRGQVSVYTKDGYFYPNKAGIYTIEYSATDTFGNKEIKTVEVEVKADVDGLDFVINDKVITASAGEIVRVASSVTVSNARGQYFVSGTASLNGDEYDLSNYSFRPMESGIYTITLTVADYTETVVKTFALTVSNNDTPIFIDEAVFPQYFIAGDKYEVPVLNAYDFSDGTAKLLDSTVYVSQDGGESVLLNGLLEVTATKKVVITYKVDGAKGNQEVSYEIPVVVVSNADESYDMAKNFRVIDGNVSIKVGASALGFETTENSKIRFINAVQSEQFSTSFRCSSDESKKNFTKVNIYLTDSGDADICVKITYFWQGTTVYFAVNDGLAVKVPVSVSSINTNILSLNYNEETKQIYPSQTRKVNVAQTLNGETFNGFTSNRIYVDYEIAEVTGLAEFFVQSINNQSICYWDGDFVEPQIFAERTNGDVAKNTLVTIFGGRAYDVLSNYVSLSLTVKDPSGVVVSSIDGVSLNGSCDAGIDYVIKASYYGEYKVEFAAKDLNGNKKTLRYVFSVVDTVAPVIELNTLSVNASLNKTVTVKSCEISDDITAKQNLKLYVFVMSPSAKIQAVIDNGFVAKEKGTYTVYYYCYDEIGNFTIASYNIVVK